MRVLFCVHVMSAPSIITGMAWFADEQRRDSFVEDVESIAPNDINGIDKLQRDTDRGVEYGFYIPREVYPVRMTYLLDKTGADDGVTVGRDWSFILVEILEEFVGRVMTTSSDDTYDLYGWVEANEPELAAEKPVEDDYEAKAEYIDEISEWWMRGRKKFVTFMENEITVHPKDTWKIQ